MADLKISALTASTTPLTGTEVLPIVQSNTTKQVSVANLTVGRAVSANSVSTTSNSTFNTTANIGWRVGARSDNAISAIYSTSVTPDSTNYALQAAAAITYVNSPGASSLAVSDNAIVTATATALTIPSVNLVMGTAAKGVNFTANTPAAGMTSQLLNWYEEGTWTPTATASSGTITSYTSSGAYTRIGRQITVSIAITITNAGTGTGALQVSLPFSVGSVAGMGAGTEDANTGVMLQIQAAAGGTIGYVKTYLGATPIATNNLLRLTVTYFV